MRSLACSVAVITAVFALVTGPAFGRDVVNLTNGKSLTGTIIEETETEVRLLIDDIEIPLSRRNIVSIVRDGVLHPVKASEGEIPSTNVENPTPLRLKEPTPTPAGGEAPGPGTQPSRGEGFPFPGKEPLIPTLLPLGRFRLVTGSVVNLRSGPGTTHSRIAALSRGTVLMELEEEDFWVRCLTEEGKEGWISAEYTRKADAEVAAATANRLNLRAGPSVDQGVVGQLKRGQLVIVVDENEDWSHVRTLEGKYGWAASRYLRRLSDLRSIRPAIVEMSPAASESFLEQGFSRSWSPAEGGWKHLSMSLANDALVRNGVAVLLLLREESESAGEETEDVLRSSDVVWQERFTSRSHLEDLGFSLGLLETTASAVVAYVQGERGEGGWQVDVDVREQAIPGCRLGLVVQEGLQRGAVAIFDR